MDYSKHKELADFWRNTVYANIDYKLTAPITSPIEFLNAVENSSTGALRYFPYSSPYMFELEAMLKRYRDNCVFYIHPTRQEEGVVRIYYWFPEQKVILDVRPSVWQETRGKVESHALFFAYGKSLASMRAIEEANQDIVKTTDVPSGFGFTHTQ